MTATGFSWALTINSTPFLKFGNVSISHSLSGYGMSGVLTSTLTVTTYNDLVSGNDIAANASVFLTCSNNAFVIPTFYVLSREVDGNITKWTCGDKMALADKEINFSDNDFNSEEEITCSSLISKCASTIGFSAVAYTAGSALPGIIDKLNKSQVVGSSARSILEMLSETMCGYWCAGKDDKLIFVAFGTYYQATTSTQHTTLSLGSTKEITRVLVSNNENTYSAGEGNAYNTIAINSSYASSELASQIKNDIASGFALQKWNCEKGKALAYVYIGGIVFSDNVTRICTSVTMYPSRSGLFFTASGADVSEDDYAYLSSVQRQINDRIAYGNVNGNVGIDKTGIYFFENGYRSGTSGKYGFKVNTGGVIETDGAIVDKVLPSAITLNEGATNAIISLGGKLFNYAFTWDSDGNLTGMTETEDD